MGPDPSLTPDLIQAKSFTAGFRGYDQSEVRNFLSRLATEVRALRDRNVHLESAWHSAEERAARPPVLDEDTLMAAVGEETATILRTARAAAADLKTKAAADCEKALAEANAHAEALREQADSLLARETQSAEDAATRIVDGARSESSELLEKARIEADTIRARAEQERALTIEGANATRDRILEDLTRRRRVATVQIEQLRAGRERLIESYAVVRRTLEEAQQELSRADAEARSAADEVGRRMRREQPVQPGEAPDLDAGGFAAVDPIDVVFLGQDSGVVDSGAAPPTPADAVPADAAPAEAAPVGAAPVGAATASAGPPTGLSAEDDDKVAAQALAPSTRPAGAEPARAGGRRRGPFGRGRGADAAAVTAEHPAASVAVSAQVAVASDPADSGAARADGPDSGAPGDAVPHLRLVTGEPHVVDPADPADPADPSGSAVDELFARIRASRPEGDPVDGSDAASSAGGDGSAAVPDEAVVAVSPEVGDGERRLSDDDEALIQKRESVVVDLEVALARKLKRALQDEQNDLLDRLRSLRGEPSAARLLPDVDEQVARYAAAFRPLLAKAASAGAAFADEILGSKSTAGAGSPPLKALADEAAGSIVEALRRLLEQAISVNSGEEQTVLVDSLGSAYREWKTQRVERVAGDALSAAYARGAWQSVPDAASMRWVVEDLDGPCPDCDDNALAGTLPKSEAFPTGQHHPPAHSGCRCLLVPVLT
jgi:DivIVA domain-containing protein